MTPRQAALLSVNTCIGNQRYANLEVSAVIRKYHFEGLDRSFFTALFYGTVEKMITLDYIISSLSSVKIEKLDQMVLCLLRTGIYQIFFMDKVPDSAACNESVELAKRYCPKSSVGYVNAVLRSAVRNKDGMIDRMKKEGGLRAVSLLSSIPQEILEKWKADYGEETAVRIAGCFSSGDQRVTLRVNTLKITRERLCDSLGRIAEPSKLIDSAIILSGSFPVEELYGFREGLFFVQDEASQIASSLINKDTVPVGGIVVDVCACPGGKSFSAAINTENKVTIYARDLHENKLSLITGGAERLGITCLDVASRDARTAEEALIGKADAVICDVPCSGLGVIAKKPDIKYKPLSETARLPAVQAAILETASRYVKPGGFLVYSTCTLSKNENEEVVEAFLKAHEEFFLSDDVIVGDQRGMATFFPQTYGTDGFFAAKLMRR